MKDLKLSFGMQVQELGLCCAKEELWRIVPLGALSPPPETLFGFRRLSWIYTPEKQSVSEKGLKGGFSLLGQLRLRKENAWFWVTESLVSSDNF